MGESELDLGKMLHHDDYPLSAKYDPAWILDNEMGPNVLWIAEALAQVIDLKPGMRVLDMGCGKALSSIFLAKEFGVEVWATDLWIPAADNWKRVKEAGVEDRVYPIHAEARSLPFADEFFDAIVSLDSYHFFGTDVHYLEYHMLKFLKRGGPIGIIAPASPEEWPHPWPEHLGEGWFWMHSVDWWRRHWERDPGLDVTLAEALPGGWEMWVKWNECATKSGRARDPKGCASELETLLADGGRNLGFVRMTATRKPVAPE